jgi:hypothetical protein
VPWLVTVLLVAFVCCTIDGGAMASAATHVELGWFVTVLAVAAFTGVVYDGWYYSFIFRRFVGPVGWVDGTLLRGASCLPALFNQAAAQAAMALYLRHVLHVPFTRAASTMLMVTFVDAYILAALGTVGALWALPQHLEIFLWIDGFLLLFAACHLLYWKLGADFFILGRMRSWTLLDAFREALPADYLRLALLRTPNLLLDMVSNTLLLACFHLRLPFVSVMAVTPALNVIVFLPVTVAGLGSYHLAARELFGRVLGGPIPVVDAFSTLVIGGTWLVKIVIGLICYRALARRLEPSRGMRPSRGNEGEQA